MIGALNDCGVPYRDTHYSETITDNYILTECGDYILQENNTKIKIEL